MTRFIAMVSGKGGVGKTTATIGVGQALINAGRTAIAVDANVVTPNLGIHLGFLNPKHTLNQFLRQEKSVKEITHLHEGGLPIIPASPSYAEFQKTNVQKLSELFEHLDEGTEFVLIDAPSGLGYEVTQVLKNSDEVLLVVNPTLPSVMDGLKTTELAQAHNNTIGGVIVNMSHGGRNELTLREIEQILGYPILANIRADRKVRKALYQQMPVNYRYPYSRTAREFKKVAAHLCLDEA